VFDYTCFLNVDFKEVDLQQKILMGPKKTIKCYFGFVRTCKN